MKKIYLLHTQFNSVYDVKNRILNGNYDEDSNTSKNSFGGDKAFCIITFQDKVVIDYEINTSLNHDEYLILISDKLYIDFKEEIDTLLAKCIDENTEILPFFHQRSTFSEFSEYFLKEYGNNIKRTGNYFYSHITKSDSKDWKNNPFYKLKKLVDCNSEIEFKKYLNKIEGYLDSEETTKSKIDLNSKLRLLYKILNPSFTATTLEESGLEGDEKELAAPFFEFNPDKYNSDDQKTARLRHLRDVILKDVI